MYTRTVAIDRTRQIRFKFVPPDFNSLETDANDLDIGDVNDVNDLDEFDDTNDFDNG